MSDTGWRVIGRIAKQRRERLGLKQEDLRDYGGPAVTTVGKIERGAQASFPLRTQQQLEQALGWSRGTIADVIASVDDTRDWEQLGPEWEHDLIEEHIPDLTQRGPAAQAPVAEQQARNAVDLSDAELLAELTYRVRQYAEAAHHGAAPGPRQVVLAELVRRGRNPGWLMDATGLDVDELLPFLERGEVPRDSVTRKVEKALGWERGTLADPGRAGTVEERADAFVAQLRRVAG